MAEFSTCFVGCFSLEAVTAGTAAGTAAILVGQPLDTVKVRSQLGQVALESYNPREVLRLYRGFMAPLVTAGLVNAGMFGVFEACNSIAKSTWYQNDANLPLSVHFVSGFAAGAATSMITCPTSILKVQQQSHSNGLRDCARELVRQQGARGLFRGFGNHLFAEAVGKAVYMNVYELLKRQMDEDYATGKTTKTALKNRMLAGVGAGVSCWSVIYPSDVIRSRMHAQSSTCAIRMTTTEACRQLYKEGGLRAFVRGFGPTVMRAGPVAAVALPVYDLTFQHMKQMF